MISFLRGKIESIESDLLVVNVNGTGYLVQIPSSDGFDCNKELQTIHTYLYVREDRMVLYGFPNKIERDFFKTLIDTPGIGPKIAMKIISDMGPENFQIAILSENLTAISTIPGIGAKLAKKLVLELKEKFKNLKMDQEVTVLETWKDIVFEGIEALKGLGYSEREARQKIIATLESVSDQKSIKVEDLIRDALKK